MLEIPRSEVNLHKFFLLLLCIILIYQYFLLSSFTSHLTFLGPYNNTTPVISDVYDQLIDLNNFTFLINQHPCQEYVAGILLVVIVSSKPTNFVNRMVIRNTWGRSADSSKLVFLLGKTDDNTTNEGIEIESRLHGDIIQGNFVDTYRNLTYKHVMGLKWVTHHCPKAKYVLKTDDDTVVNIKELRKYLGYELSPFGTKHLITCHVYRRAPVQRSGDSKWMVGLDEYKDDYYPSYCAGWAILYSQDVIPKLLEAAQTESYFWIDDVLVTGVYAQKIGVSPTPLYRPILTRDKTDDLIKRGPQYFGDFLIGPPDLTIYSMIQIWNSLPKENL